MQIGQISRWTRRGDKGFGLIRAGHIIEGKTAFSCRSSGEEKIMAWTIMGSVGRWENGAKNDPADVTTIQTLLTSAAEKA